MFIETRRFAVTRNSLLVKLFIDLIWWKLNFVIDHWTVVPEVVSPHCYSNNYHEIIPSKSLWTSLFFHHLTLLLLSWNLIMQFLLPMAHWITWIVPSSSTTKLYTTFVPGIHLFRRKVFLIHLWNNWNNAARVLNQRSSVRLFSCCLLGIWT